jgi:hypothetical protein
VGRLLFVLLVVFGAAFFFTAERLLTGTAFFAALFFAGFAAVFRTGFVGLLAREEAPRFAGDRE